MSMFEVVVEIVENQVVVDVVVVVVVVVVVDGDHQSNVIVKIQRDL